MYEESRAVALTDFISMSMKQYMKQYNTKYKVPRSKRATNQFATGQRTQRHGLQVAHATPQLQPVRRPLLNVRSWRFDRRVALDAPPPAYVLNRRRTECALLLSSSSALDRRLGEAGPPAPAGSWGVPPMLLMPLRRAAVFAPASNGAESLRTARERMEETYHGKSTVGIQRWDWQLAYTDGRHNNNACTAAG